MIQQYQKITKYNWGDTLPNIDDPFSDPMLIYLSSKVISMMLDGKTDGKKRIDSLQPLVVERFWIDEPAAQEFKDFLINDLGPKFERTFISVEIVDNPEYVPIV